MDAGAGPHLAKCFALKPSISISWDQDSDIEISTFVIYRARWKAAEQSMHYCIITLCFCWH